MRMALRAVASLCAAGVLLGSYGAWRWYTLSHWRRAGERADASACPEAKTLYGDCAACVVAECCAEVHACYSKVDCIDLNDCTLKCAEGEGPPVPRAECPAACEKRHAASIADYHRWDDCARSRCERACPRESDEEEEERDKAR
jgi:hypothetical protein